MSANAGASAGLFDVIVVGGGPAGSATALSLLGGDPSLRVAVVTGLAGGNSNGETLTPNALPLLEQLGVSGAFLEDRPLPSHGTRSCWGGETPFDNEAVFNPLGPGWRVDRGRFDALLLSEAAARGAIPVQRGDAPDRLEERSGAMDGSPIPTGRERPDVPRRLLPCRCQRSPGHTRTTTWRPRDVL